MSVVPIAPISAPRVSIQGRRKAPFIVLITNVSFRAKGRYLSIFVPTKMVTRFVSKNFKEPNLLT